MAKRREMSPLENDEEVTKIVRRPPAKTLEGRERQMAALAMDLVEERMLNKSATSQETTHFLKLVSTEALLHQKKLEAENALLQAKIDQLASSARLEEKYDAAIAAMRAYSGQEPQHSDEEYYDD